MYLIPRLIGVGIFSVILMFVYLMLINIKSSQRSVIIIVYLMILSVIAYFFVPATGSDLYRLIPIMNAYSSLSFSIIKEVMISNNTPGTVLYFFIIGKLGNDGFLAGITTLIFYAICFYILNDYSKRYKVASSDVAVVLLLFMARGSYGEVIGGIRTMLSFSIIALCCYREFVLGKSFLKNILLYLIASSIHQAALSITLIRICFILVQKTDKTVEKIYQILTTIPIIFLVAVYGTEYISAMKDKALMYFQGDAYTYVWEYILGFVNMAIVANSMFWMKKIHRMNNEFKVQSYNLLGFMFAIYIIAIISAIFDYNTFHRIEIFISIMNIPLLLGVLKNIPFSEKKQVMKKYLIIISVLMLLLACSRGNLSSLKFFGVI